MYLVFKNEILPGHTAHHGATFLASSAGTYRSIPLRLLTDQIRPNHLMLLCVPFIRPPPPASTAFLPQVGRHISILFESTLEDPSLLTIPQHLLANEAASCTFADVLLSFLVHQMDDLAGYDERWGRGGVSSEGGALLPKLVLVGVMFCSCVLGRGVWGGEV